MERIISWNKDNFYNEDCLSAQKEDKWVFKSTKSVEDGALLFHINKSCLFNGRNCTVATLLVKDEDRRFALTIGFIYEMLVFGSKESQWYDYLYPLLDAFNKKSQPLEHTGEDEELFAQWEKKFDRYYRSLKKEFGWTLIDTKAFNFKSIAAFILSSIVMIDVWLGPCLLPGGILPSKIGLKDCNATLVTMEDVCSLCGEEICGCEDIDGEESDEEEDEEDDQEDEDDDMDGDDSSDIEDENGSSEEEGEELEVVKTSCITIVAGSDNVEGGINPLEANAKLTINVMDVSEMQYSNLFEMEEEEDEEEEEPAWFDIQGKPSNWLLYQLDPYSKLTDKKLSTKLRCFILAQINELQKNSVPKDEEIYISLRKALKHSYQNE